MAPISEKMNQVMNGQIKLELESAYIYLSMSTWLKEHSYHRLANWFEIQTKEEFSHAMKFVHHIVEAGGKVEYSALDKPRSDWSSVQEIIKTAYEHEQFITGKINELYNLAEEINERTARTILQWFIDEQVEEEANASELLVLQAAYKNDYLFDHHTKRKE
ncbi:MAG: ferritin [Candidatus Odinarchaeota archaeon]